MREKEFWKLTPKEYHALVKAWKNKVNREYLCAGIVAATVANVNRDPKRRHEPFTPLDFTPIERPERTEADEQAAMTAHFANLGIVPVQNGTGDH